MIVVVGDIGWDFVVRSDRLPQAGQTVVSAVEYDGPGGGSANTAVTIAAAGFAVGLVASVGRDTLGEALRRRCSRYPKLHAELAEREGPTQFALILLSSISDRTVIVGRAVDSTKPSAAALRLVANGSVVWINHDDTDVRYAFRSVATGRAGLPLAHLEEEASAGHDWQVIVGSATDHQAPSSELLYAVGARLCVVTEGEAGGEYWTPKKGWRHFASEQAPTVRDTLGAGDAFLAGVLVGLHQQQDASSMVRLGARFGRKAVEHSGGWPSG